MNPLLRLAGLYFDTLLKTWFPLEKEPSLEDLERSDALGRLVFLVEDIRNTLSSVVSEAAVESPEVTPSAISGHPNHNRAIATTIGATCRAHQTSRDENGDWLCLCGQRFWWESDWRDHLGESIADELARSK